MTPGKFIKTCQSLYGPSGWQAALAADIEVDPSSVRRWTSGAVPVPGPVKAFLKLKADFKDLHFYAHGNYPIDDKSRQA